MQPKQLTDVNPVHLRLTVEEANLNINKDQDG